MFIILKFQKQKIISASLSGLILIILILYAFCVGGTSMKKASAGEEETFTYDIENLMSFYVDSRNNNGTLLYIHYSTNAEDSDDITCLSCHEIDTLRRLYLLFDLDAIEQANMEMASSNEACLVCHGSYEELAALTAGYREFIDLENNIANPHEFGGGLNAEHKVALCSSCHTSVHHFSNALYSAYIYCWDCHHAGVFECYTCHELEEHQMQ